MHRVAGASRGLRTGRPRAGSRPRRQQVRQEEQCRPPTTARPLLATSPLQLHPLQPPPTHTHLFLIFTNMMEKQNLDAGLSRDERPGASHQSPDASSHHRRGFHEPRARSPSPASYRTGTWSGAPPSPAAKVRLRGHFRVIFFIIFFEVEHLPGNKRLSQLPGAAMTKDPRPEVHTTVTCRLPVLGTGRPTPA